jgi:hypothetical protein
MAPKVKAKPVGQAADAIASRKRDALRAMKEGARPAEKKAAPAVPPATDMKLVERRILPPPDSLSLSLGNPAACFCVAVKIHDWPPDQCNMKRMGSFGYYTTKSEACLEYGRTIQLGWSAGRDSMTDIYPTKTATVLPAGFVISAEASKHGVNQALAESDGRPLGDVLREFMTDLDHAVTQHGARGSPRHFHSK